MSIRNGSVPLVAAALLSGGAAACSESPTGVAGGPGAVSLSLAVHASSGAFASVRGATFDLTLDDAAAGGTNDLTLTRVALVLREIELKRAGDGPCASAPEVDDECEEFEAGPVLFELPLDGSVMSDVALGDVAEGAYDRVEFEIHRPEDDGDDDSRFLGSLPEDFTGVSIRAEGSFNGTGFTYETGLNAEQEHVIDPPLVVGPGATGPANVTLFVDVDSWFRMADGTLVDPATANEGGANERLVEENIKASIDAFRDDDHDAIDDHDEASDHHESDDPPGGDDDPPGGDDLPEGGA
ncbi:MAG: hypothetical protein ACE5HF_07380 [Gemmatimonadota bacterium]